MKVVAFFWGLSFKNNLDKLKCLKCYKNWLNLKMGPAAKGWCSVSEVELLDDFATISNYLYVEKIASKSK